MPLHWLAPGLLLIAAILLALYQTRKPLPKGLSIATPLRAASGVRFLSDVTYVDGEGRRACDQQLFDEIIRMVRGARRRIVLDMFLFNPFQGKLPERHRSLCDELTSVLLERKRALPELDILLLTDPFNTLYGGMRAPHLECLAAAGVQVINTRLTRLRDSNPLWSVFWRIACRPFGNSCRGGWLPNPVGPGKVTLRTYLVLLNFKANHRKTLVVDEGDGWRGLVTSANPHDASSAHDNVGLVFSGAAAHDLLRTELAVARFSGAAMAEEPEIPQEREAKVGLQVLTESRIRDAMLCALEGAGAGDEVRLIMFFLAHRGLVRALKAAVRRGVRLRILLDPNRDAFGREKRGIPNRPVAHELQKEGIPVRWADTHGEQCHTKLLLVTGPERDAELILGSANATRRNLNDYNLETDIRLVAPGDTDAIRDAETLFERQWHNTPGQHFSVAYGVYAEASRWRYGLYRLLEASGWSVF
ncbi:phospholipase D family protein [Mangrovitalea sediminis]|uniref:phospholipase D family protein n=1 Tax=Mangrovitalea sediminis TaxID=1982043 RepID=UPI000BE627AC|nr:phospholipase D family protein [Mangrovitalea sediminis]